MTFPRIVDTGVRLFRNGPLRRKRCCERIAGLVGAVPLLRKIREQQPEVEMVHAAEALRQLSGFVFLERLHVSCSKPPQER